MRKILIWSDVAIAPEHAPAGRPTAPPEGLAARPDYLPVFDPANGISRDGATVFLTARVESAAFDGSMVAPEFLSVEVYSPDTGELLAAGRTAIHGPGPIAVPVEGPAPGEIYRFDLLAEFPD